VHSIYSRQGEYVTPSAEHDDADLDSSPRPQIILRDGEEIHPPAPQQRRLLVVLASHPGEVVAREAISQRIWGSATAQ
jgi:DNA-binding winged helix-turn-helix (wHTH) protein